MHRKPKYYPRPHLGLSARSVRSSPTHSSVVHFHQTTTDRANHILTTFRSWFSLDFAVISVEFPAEYGAPAAPVITVAVTEPLRRKRSATTAAVRQLIVAVTFAAEGAARECGVGREAAARLAERAATAAAAATVATEVLLSRESAALRR